jgi:energy-coupling factor transporter ATP-binding protein EcfA2
MAFEMRSNAVSAIIFGENGVGKSTIVDAIEFALQGRIGRSSYFDSPLLPSIRNLSVNADAWAEARVSDHATIERSVVTVNERTEIRPQTVRPGFRLAPISIKRSDILRFLDTEAMERGSVFLDYFPADAEQLAVRPEEEVHRLQAEMADLRIRRSTLANELSELIPEDISVLSNRGKFEAAVRKHIMNGLSIQKFEAQNGWNDVPVESRNLIGQLGAVFRRVAVVKHRMEQTTQIFNPIAHENQLKVLHGVLRDVGIDISQAFPRIASDYPIDKIEVVFGASSTLSLDIVITLSNGFKCFPQQIFSEAYQDLLALLFFTAVAKEAAKRGQARILLMDDVLQSIDANVRHSFVDYILTEFGDWQLIFTTHDRFWRDQLRDIFDAHEHPRVDKSVYSWDFEGGPRLMVEGSDSLSRDLVASLESAEPRTIGALAGQLLEVISDQLTRRMNLKVARTMTNRYTLGDLWPAVLEALSKTSVWDIATRIASHRMIRNLVMHANDASLGLSLRDAKDFANSVLDLYKSVRCDICNSWVRGQRHPTCTCGNLHL